MPEFDYRATDAEGDDSSGRATAESVEELVEDLREQGVQVSSVTGGTSRRRLFEPRRFNLDEFAFFNAELAAACKRGVPLPGALRALSHDLTGRAAREALEHVAADVEGGTDFADALARRGDVFPPAYAALVKAGVASGDLAGTLLLFADEARLAARVRRRLVGVVIYPLTVAFLATCLLAIYAWTVLPPFLEMFDEMSVELPTLTMFHLRLAPFLLWAPVILLCLMALVPALWAAISRGAEGARLLARIKLSAPVFGRFFRAVALARFSRTLANAVRAGVPLPDAISLAGLACGNAAMRGEAERFRSSVEDGRKLSDAMASSVAFFPHTLVWMAHIGEQRGEMAEAFDEYARVQGERAERVGEFIPVFASSFLAVFVGAVLVEGVVALFLPLISLMEMLSG